MRPFDVSNFGMILLGYYLTIYSDCKAIVYFGTKFTLSVYLTDIENYNGLGIYLRSLS